MSGHGRTNQLFSQIRIIVRMPEPDCFLRYRISAGTGNLCRGKSHVCVLARPAAAAMRGFKMVLFTQPSKHLCRRYMRCTECHSSWFYDRGVLLTREEVLTSPPRCDAQKHKTVHKLSEVFLPHDAMFSADYAVARYLSVSGVYLSICLSVCHAHAGIL